MRTRMVLVSIFGVCFLGAVVLFCAPLRTRAERVLFGQADARENQEQPRPLARASDSLQELWHETAETARRRYGDSGQQAKSED